MNSRHFLACFLVGRGTFYKPHDDRSGYNIIEACRYYKLCDMPLDARALPRFYQLSDGRKAVIVMAIINHHNELFVPETELFIPRY